MLVVVVKKKEIDNDEQIHHNTNTFNHCRVSSYCEVYPYLTFELDTRSNDLLHLQKYSKRQQILFNLISHLHDSGLGYRKISHFLNRCGIKTHRNKTFSNSSVYSVLKRKNQRDTRIDNQRNKIYESKISNFKIEYLTK